MLAFLKRRWVLLSCAVVLMACSCFDLLYHNPVQFYGLDNGQLGYTGYPGPGFEGETWSTSFSFHRPMLGGAPVYDRMPPPDTYVWLFVPLWIPLSAVLGWLVIRELRWREKRAKTIDANPPQP